jgi:hypothetical protein
MIKAFRTLENLHHSVAFFLLSKIYMGKGVITVIFIHSFAVGKRGRKQWYTLDQDSTREDAVWALQIAGSISV